MGDLLKLDLTLFISVICSVLGIRILWLAWRKELLGDSNLSSVQDAQKKKIVKKITILSIVIAVLGIVSSILQGRESVHNNQVKELAEKEQRVADSIISVKTESLLVNTIELRNLYKDIASGMVNINGNVLKVTSVNSSNSNMLEFLIAGNNKPIIDARFGGSTVDQESIKYPTPMPYRTARIDFIVENRGNLPLGNIKVVINDPTGRHLKSSQKFTYNIGTVSGFIKKLDPHNETKIYNSLYAWPSGAKLIFTVSWGLSGDKKYVMEREYYFNRASGAIETRNVKFIYQGKEYPSEDEFRQLNF